MLTLQDISALRELRETGVTPARGPAVARTAAPAAHRAAVRADRRGPCWPADFWRDDFWRDAAATVSRAQSRWADFWIDSAAAALAWQTRAMFPRLFG